MLDRNKIGNIVVLGSIVVGLIGCGICFARAQYYQGRIDATDEHIKHLENIRNEIMKIEKQKEAE